MSYHYKGTKNTKITLRFFFVNFVPLWFNILLKGVISLTWSNPKRDNV